MKSLKVNNNSDSINSVCRAIWPGICKARRVFFMQASVIKEREGRRKAACI